MKESRCASTHVFQCNKKAQCEMRNKTERLLPPSMPPHAEGTKCLSHLFFNDVNQGETHDDPYSI